jgi:hypothetical protein
MAHMAFSSISSVKADEAHCSVSPFSHPQLHLVVTSYSPKREMKHMREKLCKYHFVTNSGFLCISWLKSVAYLH